MDELVWVIKTCPCLQVRHHMPCPSGLVFNLAERVCDWPEKASGIQHSVNIQPDEIIFHDELIYFITKKTRLIFRWKTAPT